MMLNDVKYSVQWWFLLVNNAADLHQVAWSYIMILHEPTHLIDWVAKGVNQPAWRLSTGCLSLGLYQAVISPLANCLIGLFHVPVRLLVIPLLLLSHTPYQQDNAWFVWHHRNCFQYPHCLISIISLLELPVLLVKCAQFRFVADDCSCLVAWHPPVRASALLARVVLDASAVDSNLGRLITTWWPAIQYW